MKREHFDFNTDGQTDGQTDIVIQYLELLSEPKNISNYKSIFTIILSLLSMSI